MQDLPAFGPYGTPGKVDIEAACQLPSKTIFWHLDDIFTA